MAEAENLPKKYLNDRSILRFKKPPKNGVVMPSDVFTPNGLTEVISYVGRDDLDESFGDYVVKGSAVKYYAMIAREGKYPFLDAGEEMDNVPEEEILFSGGIQIFKEGVIHETEVKGHHLERNGRIWTGRPVEDILYTDDGLKYAVFGICSKNVERTRIIEAVLRGYESQEETEEQARFEENNKSFYDGNRTGESSHKFSLF